MMTILAFFLLFLAVEFWGSWKAKRAAPKKVPDDAEIRDAINERLEALEVKVQMLTYAAFAALAIGLNVVWSMHGWQGPTLVLAWFAAVVAIGAIYGVMVEWKNYSLWNKVVVLLVFGVIFAAFDGWLNKVT